MIDLSKIEVLAMNEVTTEAEEIIRNVRVILGTVKGQVVLDRGFGMDPDILDMPMPDAKSYFVVQGIEQISRHEPRARLEDVSFTEDLNGKLVPRVVINLVGDIA